MSFQTENVTVCVLNTGFGGEGECPIDGDYLLPDYCPDIAAILKCTVKPAVLSRQWSGDKLLIDGQCTVSVLYLDEERKCVRAFSCAEPFSCSITAQNPTDTLPFVSARVNYVNCRAASPRRIGVHGALTVKMQQMPFGEETVLSDIDGDGICKKTETVAYSAPAGSAEKMFTVSEVVDIGSGKPPVEMPVRVSCTPLVTECKQLPDKAIVKGNVQLQTLYVADATAGTTEKATHEFPFSQILDLEGLGDDCRCVTHAEVLSAEVHATADPNGTNTLLAVTIKLCVRAEAFRNSTVDIVTDAYCTACPGETETTRLVTEQLCNVRQENTALKEVLELPSDTMAEIVDLWCELLPVTTRMEGDTAYIDGHLQISMLGRDRDGGIAYYEHADAYTLQYDDRCDDMRAEVAPADTEYAIVGGKIEVRLELAVCRLCYTRGEQTALCRFETAAEPYPAERAAVRIRRAKQGDSVWDIAKSCHTAPAAVKEENGIAGDTLPEDMLLLLPLC